MGYTSAKRDNSNNMSITIYTADYTCIDLKKKNNNMKYSHLKCNS